MHTLSYKAVGCCVERDLSLLYSMRRTARLLATVNCMSEHGRRSLSRSLDVATLVADKPRVTLAMAFCRARSSGEQIDAVQDYDPQYFRKSSDFTAHEAQ